MKKLNLIVATSLALIAFGLNAQPQSGERQLPPRDGSRPSGPKMRTPQEIAQKEADRMKSELNLTDKQYKKVYNHFKKDQEYRRGLMEDSFGGGMPPQGGPGMGGPGGRGGFGGDFGGGGMPPQGGPGMGGHGGMGAPGGMGGPGGRPDGGQAGRNGQGGRPEGFPAMRPADDLITEEYLEKQENKLKKILTGEQYARWRAKHPAEHAELPPIKLGE